MSSLEEYQGLRSVSHSSLSQPPLPQPCWAATRCHAHMWHPICS